MICRITQSPRGSLSATRTRLRQSPREQKATTASAIDAHNPCNVLEAGLASDVRLRSRPLEYGPTTMSTSVVPERVDIVAEDYEWTGLPERLPAGSYPLTLRNAGPDVDEIQVFENTGGLTLPEIFSLGPVETNTRVRMAGGAIVGPGSTSQETMLELEKGTYEVVCFVPAATDQLPHFDHGMHRTLVVE